MYQEFEFCELLFNLATNLYVKHSKHLGGGTDLVESSEDFKDTII